MYNNVNSDFNVNLEIERKKREMNKRLLVAIKNGRISKAERAFIDFYLFSLFFRMNTVTEIMKLFIKLEKFNKMMQFIENVEVRCNQAVRNYIK